MSGSIQALRRAITAAAVLLASGAAMEAAAQGSTMNTAGERVILVTGSTGGLGREVATRLAAQGAHVIVHGRSEERGREVVQEIEAAGGRARFYAADFGSLAEVRRLAQEIRRDYDRLDVLINNAGIWNTQGDRQVSQDGHELHFQVNYLSGYLLTRELLPLLRSSAPSRVINVASAAQTAIDFDDVMLTSGYSGSRAYAQSKLAQIIFTADLAERLRGERVTVLSLHPATLMATDMVREAGIPPRSTVDEGADAVMRLVDATDVESGQYFNGQRLAQPNAQAADASARARLRQLSEELVGP